MPHFTPSIIQQHILNEHNRTKLSNEVSYIRRSVTSKDVQQRYDWKFYLGIGEGTDLPVYAIVRFQRRDRLKKEELKNDSLNRTSVTFAQFTMVTQSMLDAGKVIH